MKKQGFFVPGGISIDGARDPSAIALATPMILR